MALWFACRRAAPDPSTPTASAPATWSSRRGSSFFLCPPFVCLHLDGTGQEYEFVGRKPRPQRTCEVLQGLPLCFVRPGVGQTLIANRLQNGGVRRASRILAVKLLLWGVHQNLSPHIFGSLIVGRPVKFATRCVSRRNRSNSALFTLMDRSPMRTAGNSPRAISS